MSVSSATQCLKLGYSAFSVNVYFLDFLENEGSQEGNGQRSAYACSV